MPLSGGEWQLLLFVVVVFVVAVQIHQLGVGQRKHTLRVLCSKSIFRITEHYHFVHFGLNLAGSPVFSKHKFPLGSVIDDFYRYFGHCICPPLGFVCIRRILPQ